MRTKSSGETLQRREKVGNSGRKLTKIIGLTLALGLLIPVARPQKAPAPNPSPSPAPSPNPTGPSTNPTANNPALGVNGNDRFAEDRVMFLRGQVVIGDGSTIPHDVLVERVCNQRVLQQVYAGPRGDFSMQLGSRTDVVVDASGDGSPLDGTNRNDVNLGIPRRQLQTCELRTSASGFRPSTVTLMDLTVSSSNVDLGRILIERAVKVESTTVNAADYRAPKEARKAYERGMSAAKDGKSADAERYFEKAVELYPKYSRAWYELGVERLNGKDKDGAKAAFTQATQADAKYMAPYLSLASMAYAVMDWPEVVRLTEHIIELDPMNHSNVTGYVLDLDPLNSTEAYFYNAMANFQLGHIKEAEKSAIKAEHVDLRTAFPQLHLLMAEIYAEKKNYAGAISELETYIELVPGAKDVAPLQERLAKLEQLNGTKAEEKRE
jgi:tetratricopeptide (TPR) repeat protein